MVRYLISLGADLNTARNGPPNHSHQGKTALQRAVENDHTALVNSLIQAGAHIDALLLKNKKFQAYLVKVIEDNDLALVQLLTKNKNLLATPIVQNLCFIHVAAEKGRLDAIKIILKAHPDLLNQTDKFNQPPLFWAAGSRDEEMVNYFLSLGADLNKATNRPSSPNHGKTALHWAVDSDHKAIVDSLLKAGAAIDRLILENDEFQAYLAALIDDNNEALVQVLTNNKIALTTPIATNLCFIHLAAQKGRLGFIKIILKKHPDLLNHTDEFNQTPLLWAASGGHTEVVDYLLSLGADLNNATDRPDEPDDGKTALHWAVDGGHSTVVESLLKAGANIDALTLKNEKFQAYLAPVNQINISSLPETFFHKGRIECRSGQDPTFNSLSLELSI